MVMNYLTDVNSIRLNICRLSTAIALTPNTSDDRHIPPKLGILDTKLANTIRFEF